MILHTNNRLDNRGNISMSWSDFIMSDKKMKLPQMSHEEKAKLADYPKMKETLVRYIREGKSKEESEIAGGVQYSLLTCGYAAIRPWAMPQNRKYETSNPPGIPSLSERQQQVWDLTQNGLTQKEIAKMLKCSQSTVAFSLKQARAVKEKENEVVARGGHVIYQTRIHLFVHGMELWEEVKGVDLGTGTLAADIDEAISLGASEVISTHLGYSPTQLDKLAMDIILATGGKCVIIADCFATNAIADVHAVYFIRDCVHTVDIPAGEKHPGRGLPVNCSICYLDDWIRHLGVPLSENDEETVQKFNLWRGLFDKNPH